MKILLSNLFISKDVGLSECLRNKQWEKNIAVLIHNLAVEGTFELPSSKDGVRAINGKFHSSANMPIIGCDHTELKHNISFKSQRLLDLYLKFRIY